MNMTSRRDFIAGGTALAASGAVGAGVGPGSNKPLIWADLVHLGVDMWVDQDIGYPDDQHLTLQRKGPPSVLQCDEGQWREITARMQEKGLNALVIDLGEGMVFPSHPELAVKGAWSADKMRAEILRLNGMGIEAIPKINFSTCHDGWLKDYGRMVSTPTYYRVVADLIADVCEVFDEAPYFHLGFDEEMPIAQVNTSLAVVRQGDLWWHDFLYCVAEVERRGKRAICWSDYMWTNRKTFLGRMPKSVLQSNWYYRRDFGEKKQMWNEAFEKKGGWGECVQGVVTFLELEKAGFDQLPTTSNFFEDSAADPFVAFLKERVSPQRLKGFVTAPWELSRNENADKVLRGLREFGDAKRKHYA